MNKNVYGTVITAQPLQKFTRFIWWGSCWLLDQAQDAWATDSSTGSFSIF